MDDNYRKILVALMKRQLRKKLSDLSEILGPEFEGVDTKDVAIRLTFLEILGQAFYDLHNELVKEVQK